jgi:chromosome segregation ATPase
MNWAIYLTTIGAILAGAGFLHQLLAKRKEATIETLTEKNKWLQDQLDQAKNASPDSLVDKLAKRVAIQEGELERLSKDYEANESLIKTKEEELRKTKELQTELENEIERHLREYSELESKLDVCPYCQAELIELTYLEAERDSGTLRSYECGYSEIDGHLKSYCPSDPDFPSIEEFKFWLQKHVLYDEWFCTLQPITKEAQKLRTKRVSGRTEEEAQRNMVAAYNERFFRGHYNLTE